MIAGLAAAGFASDERFAAAFVRERAGRGQGPRRIARDLEVRGIGSGIARGALEPYAGRWSALAARARLERFGAAVPDGYPERARQMRFLEGRGYTAEQAHAAFDAGIDDQDSDG